MNKNQIQKLYTVLAFSVFILAALTLSYKVLAAELKKKTTVESGTQTNKERAVVALKKDLNEKMFGETIEPELPRVIIPELTEEDKRAIEARKREEDTRREEEGKRELDKKKREEEAAKKRKEEEKAAKKDLKSTNAFGVEMTSKDLDNLYRLVQSEVGFMDEKSKLLVASVVLNRVNHPKFPSTVSGVVLQKIGNVYQFSPVAPGKRFWTCSVSQETKAAVDKTLRNGDYSKGALYFVAKRYTTKGGWFDKHLAWLSHHEGQDYYKER